LSRSGSVQEQRGLRRRLHTLYMQDSGFPSGLVSEAVGLIAETLPRILHDTEAGQLNLAANKVRAADKTRHGEMNTIEARCHSSDA